MAETNDNWDLGEPREKKYKKPDFFGHTIDTSDITDGREETESSDVTKSEPIPKRGSEAESNSPNTVSSSFWRDPIGGGRVITSSYKRHIPQSRQNPSASPIKKREPGNVVASYSPDGTLLKKIEIRTWESDTEFYGRFMTDAVHSFKSASKYALDENPEKVDFFSYVPQYAHMNMRQIDYYRWLRENIKYGRHPKADLAYLLLMVYEILNLPDEIKPEYGAELIAEIWIGYRDEFPRLDAYLCEWLADYCMIFGLKMPEKLYPILPMITPKAQFKEFYINPVMLDDDRILGAIVAEAASDYDYRAGRYYAENSEMYEKHIPDAIGRAVRGSLGSGGVFALDRTYTMTRDSYCGAIVSSALKRRIDVEFCSFTRRADIRQAATALVKYCENCTRAICGIKARLNVDAVDPRLKETVDRYFHEFLPERARPAEDRFMPADYMKNYEAEDSGFDIEKASLIELNSWSNTERLTGEELTVHTVEENVSAVEGEIYSDDGEGEEILPQKEETNTESAPDGVVPGIRAALRGDFSSFCREKGIFEGDLADKINTVMLDYIGDVALENKGGKYEIIEDYREDIEKWLQENI